MKALEVLVNGRRLCLAGNGLNERTCVSLDIVDTSEPDEKPAASILVFGSRGKMVARWQEDFHQLRTGDEVTIRIVDADEVDPPVASTPAWTEFPRVKLGD